MKLTILNDTHIGAQRSAGTTPYTAWQLRQHLNETFKNLVDQIEGALCLNGDLFDTGNVALADVLQTWDTLLSFLNRGGKLVLVQGNHDLNKTLTVLSSFQFLAKLLKNSHPDQVVLVEEPTALPEWDAYVIPHLPNQDLFDAAVAAMPACTYLLLHCNYNNGFAVESDHSLNLSQEQAMRCRAEKIIFAHEHQQKEALGGKVAVVGNQFPSSVSDCLGNDSKRYAVIDDSGLDFKICWTREGNYIEKPWRELSDTGEAFVRVVGEATAAEASEVVSAISKFRNKSKSLVITNAVKIEGTADEESIKVSLEQVQAFNVLDAVLECLDEREQGVVKALLNSKDSP